MKYKLIFSGFFLVFFSCSFAQNAWTLQQCIQYSIAHNIQIVESEIQEKIAKNNLLQSQLNLLPTASTSSGYTFTYGYSLNAAFQFIPGSSQQFQLPSLSTNLTLINGLQKVNTIHKSNADLQAAGFDKQNSIQTTTLQLTNYFLQVLLNKELLSIAQSQLDISTADLNRGKDKLKTGTMAESELYQLETTEATNKVSLVQAEKNLVISLLQLKISLQLPDSIAFDVVVPNITDDMLTDIGQQNESDLYSEAVYNQPSIRSAQAKVASAIYSHKIALGTLSPTISLGYSMGTYYNNESKNFATGDLIPFHSQITNNLQKQVAFNLSMPIFQGWTRMNNISNTKLQRQIQELELNKVKNQFRQDIQQAF
ncbi:MAG TPA: TolC family protein, partial [Chitinophagales bacterium]